VSQSLIAQLMRYFMVGGVVYLSDLAIFALVLAAAPAAHLIANLAGRVAGAALGFVLHRQFTFSWAHRDGRARQALAYISVLLANIAASTVLLWLAVDKASIDPLVARMLVDAVVIAAAFVAGRQFVYRPA
jgi:putative flippase GtrA